MLNVEQGVDGIGRAVGLVVPKDQAKQLTTPDRAAFLERVLSTLSDLTPKFAGRDLLESSAEAPV